MDSESGKAPKTGPRIWLTSDSHFGHKNIIEYSKRPFVSVEEMTEKLIANWNSVVQPEDEIYHLGDIFLCKKPEAEAILKRLQGKIHLIRGNHDKTAEQLESSFVWVKDYHYLKVPDASHESGKQGIVMLHYAMKVWNKSHHGTFHAYGHSHGTLPEDPNSRSMDVGLDSVSKRLGGGPESYRPVSYHEFNTWMLEKNWVPVDQHETRD